MVTIRFDRGTLLLHGLPREEMPEGFVWDDRVNSARGDACRYRDLVLNWHREGREYDDQARAWEPINEMKYQGDRQPRDYQKLAVEAWRANGRQGQIILPTGAGKSFVAELCIADARRPALIVAPTLDLVSQWVRILEKAFGDEVGVLGGGQHTILPLTVTTYDSGYIHMERYGNRFGLVVFDEAHHLPSVGYRQQSLMSMAPFRLGLSATPERPDGLHADLDPLIGPVCYRMGIRELAGSVLASYKVIQVEVDLTSAEAEAYQKARETYQGFVKQKGIWMSQAGAWNRFLREAARSREGRAALKAHRESRNIVHGAYNKLMALETILSRHRGRRIILFTNDNATVFRISREFLIPTITHETPLKERKQALENFASGRWPVLATSRVLNEGVDIPAADVGVVLSGTSTVREHVQRLGRILRPQEGKEAVLYELISVDTAEEYVSKRRREHDAYR